MSMDRNAVFQKLNEIFEDVIDEGPISLKETTTSKDIAGWDSLAHIQLIFQIEKAFNIRFSSEAIMSWADVGAMVDEILSSEVRDDD